MIGDNALWVKIQQDYVETGTMYKDLAVKYGVSISAVRKKGAKYKWVELRKNEVEKQRKKAEAAEAKKQKRKQRAKQKNEPEIEQVHDEVHAEVQQVQQVPLFENRAQRAQILDPETDKERYARVVEDMLNRVEDAICVVDVHNAASVKLLTAALKDLRELKSLNKTELDIEEQKARIAKLKSDTRIVETEESGGVVFMPVMDARPVPPEDKQ